MTVYIWMIYASWSSQLRIIWDCLFINCVESSRRFLSWTRFAFEMRERRNYHFRSSTKNCVNWATNSYGFRFWNPSDVVLRIFRLFNWLTRAQRSNIKTNCCKIHKDTLHCSINNILVKLRPHIRSQNSWNYQKNTKYWL